MLPIGEEHALLLLFCLCIVWLLVGCFGRCLQERARLLGGHVELAYKFLHLVNMDLACVLLVEHFEHIVVLLQIDVEVGRWL